MPCYLGRQVDDKGTNPKSLARWADGDHEYCVILSETWPTAVTCRVAWSAGRAEMGGRAAARFELMVLTTGERCRLAHAGVAEHIVR